jgi:hypothetical protein
MKTRLLILAFLFFSILIIQSCTRTATPAPEEDLVPDEPITIDLPETSLSLVKKITTLGTTVYQSHEFQSQIVELFFYDSKNRIRSYDYNNGNYVYNYKYDTGNRVIEIEEITSGINTIYTYKYYKDRIVVTSNRDGYTIFLDSRKRIDKIVPYGFDTYINYVYDDRGNLSTTNFINGKQTPPYGTHTFDDHKNPFSQIAGYNLHFNYIAAISLMREAKGNTNNSTFADKSTGTVVGRKTYSYNANGFPSSSITIYNDGTAPDTELYEYTK